MEHKSWPWKKKSTEKLMIAADKLNRVNEDEANLADKVELERKLKLSDEKLLAALAEINTKDEIAKKQTNIAREAIHGWEKAEAEVLSLKQELEKATQQRVADEERLHDADSAWKECMLQLRFVREEQDKKIQDAINNTSKEYEKRIVMFEENLAESNTVLSKLSFENTQLSTTLSIKEKMIDELRSVNARLDNHLSVVVSQLESTQRENASLSYEVRVLGKELEIRNDEREFNRRTSDVAHKQYLGSVKKIAKLETEAQRLRLLVQKRLPGTADVAKMKNADEVNRRRSNPFPMVSTDYILDDASSKKIAFLTEQLCAFEEENKLLKEFLNQKSKSQLSEMGSDEKVSVAESWAPSYYTVGASDIGLMDDFVEMEKLALVSVDKSSESHTRWLDNISKMVNERAKEMKRSSIDVLDDIKVGLVGKNDGNFNETVDETDRNGNVFDESMRNSIRKLVEVIEGIKLSEKDDVISTGYTVHVFQWKTTELRGIMEEFVKMCNKLENGKVDFDKFVKELTFALEWILNHCFSLQDVSSMNDEFKKRFELDETRSESETEGGNIGQLSEVNKLTFPKDQLPGWPMASLGNVRNKVIQVEEMRPNVKEEIRKLKDDMANLESANKDLVFKLQSESAKCASLVNQLQESDKYPIKTIDEHSEVDQESISIKEQKSIIEREAKSCELDHDGTTVPSDHEITAASNKLAECQETILNLGKQLKAMASLPIDASTFDISEITNSPLPDENDNKISLLDKMNTEDPTGAPRGQKSKGVSRNLTSPAILDGNSYPVAALMSPRMFVSVEGVKDEKDEEALVNFLSVVSDKKRSNGGGVLRRLFWRKKKGNDR
ncbi:filament-like plant protein 7 isoform X2 [Rutidosis leptorrhynchoides]|uniref:filament-like plant protein 7 isoform X2 n=1 Tax=Rutidosis leptorrhynchoides TaxID=125765 RepID=UPI003A9A5568